MRTPPARGLSKQPQLCPSSASFKKLAVAQMTELCQLPHIGGIECFLTAADTDVVGVLGRVSGSIREDGTGEIQFSQNGVRRFAAARSEAGVAIPRDVEVVVMRYEQGIAWVRRWDEVAGELDMSGDAALNETQVRPGTK